MYEKYAEKVNKILETEYGIGSGTLAYKNVNKETMVLSLVMMDLIEELKKFRESNQSVELTADELEIKNIVETTKKTNTKSSKKSGA